MLYSESYSEFFPRCELYSKLLVPAKQVKEAPQQEYPFAYSERHLQCVWFDPLWRPQILRSVDGEEIIVEDPGRWNLEAGPDFFDAVLLIGPERRRVQGDVEIHIRPADWTDHKHSDDRHFSGVIAHITYFTGTLPSGKLPPGAVQISLSETLNSIPSFSFESVDVTSYPYAAFPDNGKPCARALSGLPEETAITLLESAGEERLRRKACRMAATIRVRGEDQTFYEELMSGLGYKHNSRPFRALARVLSHKRLLADSGGDATSAYALLLGVSGLMPSKMSPVWDDETRTFIRILWDAWWKHKSKWEGSVMSRTSWHFHGLRPQNHPFRRLAAAASLVIDQDIGSRIKELSTDSNCFAAGIALLSRCSTVDFWKRRLSLAGKVQDHDIKLLGHARSAAIISNVMLPFLAATGADISAQLKHLPAEQDNSLIRQTAHSLLGRDHNPAFYRSGLRQQGLLQVFHDFCLNNRSACTDCKLVSALTG